MGRRTIQPRDCTDIDERVMLRDGRLASVPRSSLSVPHGGLGGTTLVPCGPDRLVLRRTVFGVILSLLVMGFGLIVLMQTRQIGVSVLEQAMIVGFVTMFILTGMCGLLGLLFNTRRFSADRLSRSIVLVNRWWRRSRISFDDVAAVQVTWCVNWYRSERGTRVRYFLSWEINLVLAEPPLERIPLVHRRGRRQVYSEAERLAGFLGVPLLDHR